MGILITFIGMYSPICGDEPNEVRTTIGAICITIWFLMFPTISMQEKDKIMQKLGIHVILSLITVLLSSMGIWYFLNNMTKGPLKKDILYCLFGIFVFSYILYIFVGFIKTFFGIVRKIKKFIFCVIFADLIRIVYVMKVCEAEIRHFILRIRVRIKGSEQNVIYLCTDRQRIIKISANF